MGKKNVKIKGKTKHTKADSSKKYKAYKIEGDKVVRLKKMCVKCGAGVYMAEHKDRYHCGSCGYTLFKKKE